MADHPKPESPDPLALLTEIRDLMREVLAHLAALSDKKDLAPCR